MQSMPLVQLQKETQDAGAHHHEGEHMCVSSADRGMTACCMMETTVLEVQLSWDHTHVR